MNFTYYSYTTKDLEEHSIMQVGEVYRESAKVENSRHSLDSTTFFTCKKE